MSKLSKVFEPISVGNLKLKNRFVMQPMGGLNLDADGLVSQRMKTFLSERAKGGVALIFTPVNSWEGVDIMVPSLSDDKFIPGLREMVDGVHRDGALLAANIRVPRVWALPGQFGEDGKQLEEHVGPSAVAPRPRAAMPRPLTVDEIKFSVNNMGEAAKRCKAAGFDAVQIGVGIGGLLNRFMSPLTNKREDEYGGSFENRMRFLNEIIAEVRRTAGDDYTLFCRFTGHEFMTGGWDLEGGKEVAAYLEKQGIDGLNVQVGWHDSSVPLFQKEVPAGKWAYLAQGIKQVVKVPVITAYRVDDPVLSEQIVSEGKADLIGMARPFIADPEFVNKAKEGRLDDIRRCIVCCRCIDQAVGWQQPLEYCSVNPNIGEDLDVPVEAAKEPRKVVVIGAGPGGMEAARLSAERGYKVTLVDSGPKPGGMARLANILNSQVDKLLKFKNRELGRLPVEIRLGQRISAEEIKQMKPDAVVLAAGGLPLSVDVAGADGKKVISVKDISGLMRGVIPGKAGGFPRFMWLAGSLVLRYAYIPAFIRWVLGLNFPFGKKVVIVGGGFAACELAEYLGEKGKQVTLLEQGGRLGIDIGPTTRFVVMARLREFGVKMEKNAVVNKITDWGVEYNTPEGSQFSEADSIVLALGMKENHELADQLRGEVPVISLVGDCNDPKKIAEAIKAGYRASRDL
ncbi:FAD-dependent oxidoreductase [Chloroflexota bacterium]